MRYYEKKQGNEYQYSCEDIFGEMSFYSPKKLAPDALDGCMMQVLNSKSSEGTIELKANKKSKETTTIRFTFKQVPLWETDEEEERPVSRSTKKTRKPLVWRVRLKRLLRRIKRFFYD